VSALAEAVVIAHANRGSKIDRLFAGIVASGKRVYTLYLPENAGLMPHGGTGYAVSDLVDCLLGQQVNIESLPISADIGGKGGSTRCQGWSRGVAGDSWSWS
jgi:hypothetical protein